MVTAAAEVSPRPAFHLYQWLDVQDTLGDWLEAQILKLDVVEGRVQRIFVHYKGYPPKYDEWLEVSSPRIAPLHTHTNLPPTNYDIRPRIGSLVDAQDTLGDWCVGRIQDFNPVHRMYLVHYVGWSPRYDEWINQGSYRLAPYCMFTDPQAYDSSKAVVATSDHVSSASSPRQSPLAEPSGPLQDESRENDQRQTQSSNNEKLFRQRLQTIGFTIVDQSGDGNCLFRAISHQIYGDPGHHGIVRAKTVEYLLLERAYFSGYVAGSFDDYIQRLSRDGVWGDHIELQAMAELYNRPIQIFAYSTEPFRTFDCGPRNAQPIRLSYHFRSHYNSITYPGHSDHFVRSTPGTIEDESLRLRSMRSVEMVAEAEAHLSDLEAIEDAEVEAALQRSRQQFSHESVEVFDRAIQESLESLEKQYQTQLDSAILESEQNQFLHEAGLQSELLKQTGGPQEQDHLAAPIKMCMSMGYSLEQCVRAYSVLEPLQLDDEVTAAMMQEQLTDHLAQFQFPLD